ncbi:ROK family protein [Streptomyces sp. ITFR-16]|uniref:ROK family protein n=1 Tax=Streptomyces sp. ITFR-16 TaxID=3075198 RepID=UPI00288A3B44|nr:ROK family protein [Streptomyces sp. ITFR-16]WNI21467.1 ROK family protein [Streptomyces sp. ITFR-16]
MSVASGVAGSRSLLRRINSLALLRELRRGPATITRLVNTTGLSRTATEAVLSDLQQLGWVATLAPDDRGDRPVMGRPASSYRFDGGAGRMLSVDIGAHHIHAIVADLLGTPLASQDLSVDENAPAVERLRLARKVMAAVLGAAGVAAEDLWAVAVGSPGVVSEGIVRHFGGSGMPGWIGLDLAAAFADDFACSVLVEGDCALGTIAEHRLGAAQGVQDMVYILCGNRTGAGIIAGGELFRGHRGGTGLIGELPQLRWRELETDYPGRAAATGHLARLEMFNAARNGDPAALSSVAAFAEALSLGIAAMTLAVDPELVVLGGGSSHSADLYVDLVRENLTRLCPLVPRVAVSTLGGDAVALGGIQITWRHIDAQLQRTVEQGEAFPEAGAAIMAR